MLERTSLTIETPRLLLVELSWTQLGLYMGDPGALEQQLNCRVSRKILDQPVRMAVEKKLAKMAETESIHHPWFTYWLIIVRDQVAPFGAGLIGFKGIPDVNGEVEIGYGIDAPFQGHGYATEAVRALTAWAFQQPGCRAAVAETHKQNTASQRVLQKAGWNIYDQTDDSWFWRVQPASLPEKQAK